MQIVAALFLDEFDMRETPGPSTRLDLTGVHFSTPAPNAFPVRVEPHLVVLVRCGASDSDTSTLEVVYRTAGADPDDASAQKARNVQMLQVEPGKFSYRLVRAELEFEESGTIEAHCSLDSGPVTIVPFTMLEPVD